MFNVFCFFVNVRMQLGWGETCALLTCTSTCVARNQTAIFCSQFYVTCCCMISLLLIFELTGHLAGNMTQIKKYTPRPPEKSPASVCYISTVCMATVLDIMAASAGSWLTVIPGGIITEKELWSSPWGSKPGKTIKIKKKVKAEKMGHVQWKTNCDIRSN